MSKRVRAGKPGMWISAVAAIILAGCGRRDSTPEAAPVIPVEVLSMETATLKESTRLPGVLSAYRAVDVVSEVSAKVVRIRRDTGASVAKREVLAELEKDVLRETQRRAEAALLGAQARLEKSEADFTRDSTLIAHRDIAPAAFEASQMAARSARAEADAARAALELARHDLDQADIRAPFPGIVSRRHCDIGQYVVPGTPLFRVVDIDSLRLILNVSQRDVSRLDPGAEVEVMVDLPAPTRFAGRIRSIGPEADAVSRTFPVEVILNNPPGRPLRDGLVVRADLPLGRRDQALAVPREAVLRRSGEHCVFVVQDSTARRRTVRIGPLLDDRYVIEDGLRPGERVVVVGMQNLQDGATVRIEDEIKGGTRADLPAEASSGEDAAVGGGR